METTFYDLSGKPIAYTQDGQHIYLFSGQPVGHIDRDSIFSFSGKHLGWFYDGWVRDHRGACVFFTPETGSGGPVKPVKQVKPVKSVKQVKPVKGVKQVRPVKAVRALSWSPLSGPQFFAQ